MTSAFKLTFKISNLCNLWSPYFHYYCVTNTGIVILIQTIYKILQHQFVWWIKILWEPKFNYLEEILLRIFFDLKYKMGICWLFSDLNVCWDLVLWERVKIFESWMKNFLIFTSNTAFKCLLWIFDTLFMRTELKGVSLDPLSTKLPMTSSNEGSQESWSWSSSNLTFPPVSSSSNNFLIIRGGWAKEMSSTCRFESLKE